MSSQNTELTNQETQEKEKSGRNPLILAGGLILLVGAFLLLIFGGALFRDSDQAAEQAVVQEPAANEVQLPTDGPPLQVGDQPYEFALQNLDGETVTLSQFISQPILLNFWATWCGPCRIEMPEIQAVWEEHQDDGLVVLALNQDETAPEAQAYFEELGLTFTPLLDEDSETAKNYGLQGTLPSSVFINPDGQVSVIHRGVMTRGQLDMFLAETLPEEVTLDEEEPAAQLDELESGQEAGSTGSEAGSQTDTTEATEGESQTNGVTILTEDDRSERLRRLTQAWNTNFNLHSVPYDEILSGGPPRDGIRSIDNPKFISNNEAAEWLADNEPVIALEINGDARAYPLQIITWHEIVNDEVGGVPAVVTFCPLCNSALAFDRRVNGVVFEFGVSGLLRNSDLIMYDRTTETLWQQFTGEAIVGDHTGERLTFLPTSIVSFADFREAYPDGQILSRDTGLRASYGTNPYAGYDTYQHVLSSGGNLPLFQGEVDGRLEPADRVVTVSLEEAGIDIAYPVIVLEELRVVNDMRGDQDLVIFFTPGTASALGARVIAEAEDVGATGVFDPNLDGQKLTFSFDGENIVDDPTGSTWNILGQAVEGPLAGQELGPIVHGDHFWFSWAAFKPDTIIFQG